MITIERKKELLQAVCDVGRATNRLEYELRIEGIYGNDLETLKTVVEFLRGKIALHPERPK